MSQDLFQLSTDQFIDFLKSHNIKRAYFVYDYDNNKVLTSHKALEPIADQLTHKFNDYDMHEGIFLHIGPESGTLQCAFVHNTNRGQAQGGTRFWSYNTLFDFFFDGIRLSRGMTFKNALADIWWGGGKGIIAVPSNTDIKSPEVREKIFQDYGRLASSIQGAYVTAEDVGVVTEDIDNLFSTTRFVTCIPMAKGGSGNPSHLTSIGVVRGMEGALAALGKGNLKGKSVAVQGTGNVARFLMSELEKKEVGKIIACDIFESSLNIAKETFKDYSNIEYRLVEKGDDSILFEDVDIVAPCATGGILNNDTIPRLKAPIVCGASNNQLKDEDKHSNMLKKRKIVYVPDFLTNRMGIVNCANEQYGSLDSDPAIERHLNYEWENAVYVLVKQIVEEALATEETTGNIALRMAKNKTKEFHPIWGNRSRLIIRSIMKKGWADA